MNPPGVRRAAVVLAALAAVLGLSGCFKMNHDMEVKADGSGSATLHIEVNKKAIEAFNRSLGDVGGMMPSMEEVIKPIDKTFPDGTRVTSVNDADRSTLDASFDFDDAADYDRRMQQVGEAVAADPDDDLTTDGATVIRRTGDRMDVSLEVGSAAGGPDEFDMSELQGLLEPSARPSVVFTVTMPGKIVTTNGQKQGRTVTWDLLSSTAPATLTVTSEVENEGLPAWALPAGGGLLFVTLLALLAVLLSQRKKSAKPAGPTPPYQPAPWPPTGAAPGAGTFFPPPAGVPPREPVPWSQPPPPVGGPPPPSGPGGWSQPPPPGGPSPSPGPAPWSPSPSALPTREPEVGPTAAPPPSGGPPPSGQGDWTQPPPPPPSPAPRPPTPSPAGFPTSGPEVGSTSEPPSPTPAPSPWAPAPPADALPSTSWVIKPEPPPEDPLPWRVPGSTASPVVEPEPVPEPAPEPEPEPTAAAPAVSDIEAGWYSDPAGGSGARYWDGQSWTEHTR